MNSKRVIVALVIFLLLPVSPANAFSVNSLKIEVQENGDANCYVKYSLSWLEKIQIWVLGVLRDKDASKIMWGKWNAKKERGIGRRFGWTRVIAVR